MRITLRPNGYAICALLAGALVGGALSIETVGLLELLALWVLADLALGAYYAGLVHAVRGLPLAEDRRPLAPAELGGVLLGAALALLIAASLGEPLAYLTRMALALGVVVALAAGRRPHEEAAPMLVGLQVLVAWTLGFLWVASWQNPLLALGLVAGIGTWCRLRAETAPGPAMLWATRLTWAVWVGALLVARQPLLASLVGVTAIADDLHRLAPRRQSMPEALLNLSWLGSWFLVAMAASYWAVVP